MKIYHYTNLESLALILKNRTIRFNRLDKVDDIEEGNAESLGVRFCQYVFVSCWTKNPKESIPLWKMYGGDFGGVRIAVEHKMFREYPISEFDSGGINVVNTPADAKVLLPRLIHQDCFIMPPDYDNDLFYRHVKYEDDVSQYTKDAIQKNNVKDGRGDIKMEIKSFGYYKNKHWEFQNETRFVLYVFPFNPISEAANTEIATIVAQSFLNNKALPFTYYDMELKDEVVDNIEITLSPSTTEAQKVIIQALVDRYAPKARILDSMLGKLVRLK